MIFKPQRRAHLCVTATATALFAGLAFGTASASEMHIVKQRETVDSLARRYHVSVKDILKANHLSPSAVLLNGRHLLIPNAPKPHSVAATIHESAQIKSDRISMRIGPGEEHRRVELLDSGTKVTVTAVGNGWAQISLKSGKTGWVRTNFIHLKSNRNLASHHPAPKKKAPEHSHAVAVLEEQTRKRIQRAKSAATAKVAKKHHEEKHPGKQNSQELAKLHKQHKSKIDHDAVAKSFKRHHDSETVASRNHKKQAAHEAEAAAHRHKQHLAEIAENRRHEERLAARRKHEAQIASAHQKAKEIDRHYTRPTHSESQASSAHHFRPEAESPSATTDIVRSAIAYRGTPYRWGASRPGGFDCSGFTKYVYGRKGVALPRTAAEQFHSGTSVSNDKMKPGDLVFFHTTRGGISHVGMYVGSGKFVHSSSSKSGGVRVDNLNAGYYNKAFRGARRVQKEESTEGSGE